MLVLSVSVVSANGAGVPSTVLLQATKRIPVNPVRTRRRITQVHTTPLPEPGAGAPIHGAPDFARLEGRSAGARIAQLGASSAMPYRLSIRYDFSKSLVGGRSLDLDGALTFRFCNVHLQRLPERVHRFGRWWARGRDGDDGQRYDERWNGTCWALVDFCP